jgi:hypothetical protein
MPGTGLGMSMVKEIVDLAGGKIDVRSKLGIGTEIKLSLPLESCAVDDISIANGQAAQILEDGILAVRRRTRGRTVTIRGFDNHTGTDDVKSQGLASLKASIIKYVTEWFHLTLVSNDKANSDLTDIVISDESVFLELATPSGNELLNEGKSLLILCSNGARRGIYASRMDNDHVVEFVSKPCGPHRLAKALLNCLDKEDAMDAGNRQVSHDKSQPTKEATAGPVESEKDSLPRSGTLRSRSRTARSGSHGLVGDFPISMAISPSAPIIDLVPDRQSQQGGKHSASSVQGSSPEIYLRNSESPGSSIRSSSVRGQAVQELSFLSSESKVKEVSEIQAHTTDATSEASTEAVIHKRRPKMLLVEVCSCSNS